MSDQSKIDLYNLALEEIGQSPISSFEDDSPAAANAASRYDQTLRFMRGLRFWSFEKEIRELNRRSAAPTTGYDYAFSAPGGQTLAVFREISPHQRPLREGWRVYKNEIHSHFEQLWAEIRVEKDPPDWPALFREAFIKDLAASLCGPQTGNMALKRELAREARGAPNDPDYPRGGLIGAAIADDSQTAPPEELTIARGPLNEARDH